MADPESCLKNALCTVSVHADSVWWHEAKDKYRLANLNLWLHVLRTQSQPLDAQLDYQDDRVAATCRCPKKSLQEVELPEEMIPDPEAWLKGHSWPTAIARNFPAISIALVGEHSFCRGLELLSEQNLPYKVETSDEVKLYRRTCCESVRNIWLDLKHDNNKVGIQRRDSSSSINPNLSDYCPSVLQLHRPSNTQPTYPTITDHSYQSDLFPYHELSVEQEQNQQWHINNSATVQGQQGQATGYSAQQPQQAECYGEWRARQSSVASLLVLQRATAQRSQRVQRPQQPYQQSVMIGQQQYQPQPILLSSDFPELPNRGNEHPVHPGQIRRPFLPDPGNFSERRAVEIPELRAWLQSVYPQRAAEFSTMAALASRFEEVARRIIGRSNQEAQPPQTDVQQLLEQGQNCQEGRRLYRDVVASKVLDEDSETNLEVKFQELEREALEQYLNSQNDIDEEPEAEISPDVEEKFLDLERQAIEQYEEQGGEIEEPTLPEEPKNGSPFLDEPDESLHLPEDSEPSKPEPNLEDVQTTQNTVLLQMETIVQQKSSNWVQEQLLLSTSLPETVPEEEMFEVPVFRESETPRTLLAKEEEPKQKKTSQPVEGKRRGRKEPAPTPSCVRLPRRGPAQKTRSPTQSVRLSEKCEKKFGAKSVRPSRSNTAYQERSGKKGQDNFRKSFYKKKEPSPKPRVQLNKKRPPPLSVVDKEVRSLVNCLKARTLNFLKDVDIRMLTEEHSKVALRELLYKKQQKESIRKEVRIMDIQDTDTLRLYVREIASLARQQMQLILKRVRDDVIDMTSRKTIFIAQPTTAEKRKVRYLIKKCLELMEKAESLKKMPKKPLESSKKEISDTLATIHKTMDVVYLLRDMCRETYEDMEYLKSSRETVVEILLGRCYLEDKSDYIRQRVEKEKLSLLLYCLFPKRESVLFDREWAKLVSRTQAVYMFSDQQLINNTLLINHQPLQWAMGVKQARFVNWMTANRPRRKELWSEDTWEKCLIIGCHSRPVDVFVDGPRSVLVVPVFRKEAVQESQKKIEQEPKKNPETTSDSQICTLKAPRKRKAGTKSDTELISKQPTLATERSYWTWPKTYKTSNLLRLLKTQPKQRKKPVVKNDSGCSLM